MYHVGILVSQGVPLFELGCALEVFSASNRQHTPWYKCDVISFDQQWVTSSCGLPIKVTQVSELLHYDTLLLPSWDTQSKKIKVALAEQIIGFHSLNKRIVTFSSGAFLPAQLGMLNHQHATTHWRFAELFKHRFELVRYVDDVLFTQSNNIFCSAGSSAALDLAIEIVRQDFGHEQANSVARRLIIPPHRSGGQIKYVEQLDKSESHRFSTTLERAKRKISSELKVDDLANHANMSRRSFDRHFKRVVGLPPKEWLNQQRIQLAKQLLEVERIGIDELAKKVGYDNPVTLRFNFQKFVGIAPSEYQQQFFKGNIQR